MKVHTNKTCLDKQNENRQQKTKRLNFAYSYFEKRCLKKAQLHKPISKGSMGGRIELLHVLNTNEI